MLPRNADMEINPFPPFFFNLSGYGFVHRPIYFIFEDGPPVTGEAQCTVSFASRLPQMLFNVTFVQVHGYLSLCTRNNHSSYYSVVFSNPYLL